jgi:hypothetical protein
MTQSSAVDSVRAPAVAGMFYPADAAGLRAEVARCFAGSDATGPAPKALVVPHAGLVYSGPVAAAAYARLRAAAESIRRVVLIGPSHRVAFHGVAVPSVSAFASPLGRVEVDTDGLRALGGEAGVVISDRAHASEHSLEVQLPFLQSVLPHFRLLPLVAGHARPEDVARILERAWGGAETLIVVSTDLSHFHEYAQARALDASTCRRILAMDSGLDGDEACGCVGLNGFLLVARRRGLVPEQLDMRNSGDTAGDRSRVVGYGAFAFHEPGHHLA